MRGYGKCSSTCDDSSTRKEMKPGMKVKLILTR